MKMPKGFTIVELIIVLVVIGILLGVAGFAWGNYSVQRRDSLRSNHMNALKASLESFHDDNGRYPLLAEVNSLSIPGIKIDILSAPGDTSGSSSLRNTLLPSASEYGYTTYDAVNAICTAGSSCGASYTLSWLEEGTSQVTRLESLH